MKAPNSRRQKTLIRDGRKVRVVSRRITRQANIMGYKVTVSLPEVKLSFTIDYRFFGTAEREVAEEEAIRHYLKDGRSSA